MLETKTLFGGRQRLDAILIMNTNVVDPNFLYFTGFTSGVFERAILIITKRGMTLITDSLERETAMKQRPRGMKVVGAGHRSQILNYLKKTLKNKVVGINGAFLPYSSYKRLKQITKAKRFVDATNAFYKIRSIKSASELQKIRKANKIIKKTLKNVQAHFKEGMTERQLAAKVDGLMTEYGASGPSFSTIVCFGANASMPHHMPEDKKLEKNSFILIDCGARYKNYCSDVTRTFIFKPDKNSEKYRRMLSMLNTVKEAQRLALNSIKVGASCEIPHKIAAKYIDTTNNGVYRGKFIHGLGHALGIEVHDLGPGLYPGSKERMKEGMVFSDEPGIYIPGFGGVRFEDDVVVTRKGGKVI